MKTNKLVTLIFLFLTLPSFVYSDYPNTSIGVIDLNFILSEASAAKDAATQIEEIAKVIEAEIIQKDDELINEQNLLIESQAVMAPEAFDLKRKDYENKVQNYNIERQSTLAELDMLVSVSRSNVLNALKPILEEISNEKGITILLEKQSALLNADGMDITEEALKKLNKELPKLKVSRD